MPVCLQAHVQRVDVLLDGPLLQQPREHLGRPHQPGVLDIRAHNDPAGVEVGLYPISRYNRRIDVGYLHFCPINITFKWVMNKTPRKMYKTKRPPMYKSAVIKSYIS